MLASIKTPFEKKLVRIEVDGEELLVNTLITRAQDSPSTVAAAVPDRRGVSTSTSTSTDSSSDADHETAASGGDPSPTSPPPLVLLHGFGAGLAYWCLSIDAFAQKYRVYALDWPGFGFSSRIDLSKKYPAMTAAEAENFWIRCFLEWKRQVGLWNQKVHLLGHSMGGYLSASIALAHPEHVATLTLADPWGIQPHPKGLQKPIFHLVADSVAQRVKKVDMKEAVQSASSFISNLPKVVRMVTKIAATTDQRPEPVHTEEEANAVLESAERTVAEEKSAAASDTTAATATATAAAAAAVADKFFLGTLEFDDGENLAASPSVSDLLLRALVRMFSANHSSALAPLRSLNRELGMRALLVAMRDMHDRYKSALLPEDLPMNDLRSPVLAYTYETNILSPAMGEQLFDKLYTSDLEWAQRPLANRMWKLDSSVDVVLIWAAGSWLRKQQHDGIRMARRMKAPVSIRRCPGGHQVFADDPTSFHAAFFGDHLVGDFEELHFALRRQSIAVQTTAVSVPEERALIVCPPPLPPPLPLPVLLYSPDPQPREEGRVNNFSSNGIGNGVAGGGAGAGGIGKRRTQQPTKARRANMRRMAVGGCSCPISSRSSGYNS